MPESDLVLARSLVELDRTLAQIEKLVAKGRRAVESDDFLPLAAQQLGVRLGHDVSEIRSDWRNAKPGIRWRSIIGLRNRLAHDYHQVDFDIVWSVFATDAPQLRTALTDDVEWARSVLPA